MRFLEKIFSVKNIGKHKVWTILGLKFKFKRKTKNSDVFINSYIKKNRAGLEFSYHKASDTVKFVDYRSIGCRNISTIKMLSIAMYRVRKNIEKSFKITVLTGDYISTVENEIWAYSRFKNTQENVKLIPDFFFDCWKEIGCNNFDEWTKKIVENSKKEPVFDKLFWSGTIDLHPLRQRFYELASNNNKLECDAITFQNNEFIANKKLPNNIKITLTEHPRYKYLLDLPGVGYSGRFKALLFSGRPVFKVEDNLEEFFYKDLVPFVHYIPVKNDLSDLEEKLEWAENNYDKALEIAKNAQEYAIENLNFEKCIQYLEKIILEIGK